jgi:hypothetical protein
MGGEAAGVFGTYSYIVMYEGNPVTVVQLLTSVNDAA